MRIRDELPKAARALFGAQAYKIECPHTPQAIYPPADEQEAEVPQRSERISVRGAGRLRCSVTNRANGRAVSAISGQQFRSSAGSVRRSGSLAARRSRLMRGYETSMFATNLLMLDEQIERLSAEPPLSWLLRPRL